MPIERVLFQKHMFTIAEQLVSITRVLDYQLTYVIRLFCHIATRSFYLEGCRPSIPHRLLKYFLGGSGFSRSGLIFLLSFGTGPNFD